MNRLIDDIAVLTNISTYALEGLIEKSRCCICHSVYEDLLNRENPTEIDIGIGTLYIKCEDSDIKYKFIPSKKLEEEVAFTIRNKLSPLTMEVDATFKHRIENTYKQLL